MQKKEEEGIHQMMRLTLVLGQLVVQACALQAALQQAGQAVGPSGGGPVECFFSLQLGQPAARRRWGGVFVAF